MELAGTGCEIRLDAPHCRMLREVAVGLGAGGEGLVEALVEAAWTARGVVGRGSASPSREALSHRFARLLEYGYVMDRLVEGLLSRLRGEGLGFALEDAGWLEGFEGIYFDLVKTSGGSPWVDSVHVQLQSRGWAYARFESLIGFRGDIGDYEGAVERAKRSLEELLESEEYYELESEWADCADTLEARFSVYSDEDSARIVGEVYVSDWSCLPPLTDVERIFEAIFRRAGLEHVKRG